MTIRATTPLVLALVAAALGAYILLIDRNHASTDQARGTHGLLLPDLRRDAVTQIDIDRGAKGRVVLAHVALGGGGSEWRLDPGGNVVAAAAVAELLDALDGLEIDRETTAAPGATGLAAPTARMVVNTATRRRVIDLGHGDATGRGVFVRVAGEPRTVVVNHRLLDLVDRDGDAFRDRTILAPGLTETATAIAFESLADPGRSSTGTAAPDALVRKTLRKRDGVWLNNEGFFASRAGIAEALRTLATLQGSSFPKSSARPAWRPSQSVELTAAGPSGPGTWRLDIWRLDNLIDACPVEDGRPRPHLAGLSASTGGPTELLCLEGVTVERLWRVLDVASHRDLRLLVVDPAQADGVVLSQGDRRLHLRRDRSTGWRITEPAVSFAADPHVIDDWLVRLAQVTLTDRAPAVVAARAVHRGLAAPARPARLEIEGSLHVAFDVTPSRLPHDHLSRVQRAGEAGAAAAPDTLVGELDPDPLRFRSRAVLSLPRFDVVGVEISAGGGHVGVRRGTGDTWIVPGASRQDVDQAALDRLLAAVSDLQAERFLSGKGDPPDRTVDFEIRESGGGDKATTRHQRVEIARSCLVRLADTPVFQVNATSCADLRQEITRDITRTP